VEQKIKTNVCSATFVVVRCWAVVLLKLVLLFFVQHRFGFMCTDGLFCGVTNQGVEIYQQSFSPVVIDALLKQKLNELVC